MGYNIGSFNLHNIGVNALLNNNPRDLAKIATIIKNEGFDVVALHFQFNQRTIVRLIN